MKKIILVTSAALMMTVINLAYATPTTSSAPPTQPGSGGGFGLAGLEQYIGQLYVDGKEWVQARDHRPITNLAQVQATNTAQVKSPVESNATVSPTELATMTAQQDTAANLRNSLMQYNYAMYRRDKNVTNQMQTGAGKPYEKNYVEPNSLTALTVGENAGASDTLSVRDLQSKISSAYLNSGNKSLLETPKSHDDFFDFSVLLNTPSYTTSQEHAANEFIKYAAQSTQDLTKDIDFEKLYGNPAALLKVKQNSTYQQYVMMIRTLLALRSVTVNSLNQLVAERTPVDGLGQAAGLKPTVTSNAIGQQTTTFPPASPLQVEAYQANHDVESPAWYQSIQTESPASLQRDTLIMLAEIKHQNYQAHLDRERLLAEVSAMNLELSMQNMKTEMQQGDQKVNAVIQTAVSGNAAPAAGGSSGAGVNTTATPGETTTTDQR